MHHTIKCRDRIRKLLEESENQDVLDRAAQRQSEYVAKQVQAAAEAGNSGIYGGNADPGSSNRGGEKADSVEGPFTEAEDLPVPGSDVEDSDLDEVSATVPTSSRKNPAVPDEDANPTKKARMQGPESDSNKEKKRREKDFQKEEKNKKRRIEKDDFDFC